MDSSKAVQAWEALSDPPPSPLCDHLRQWQRFDARCFSGSAFAKYLVLALVVGVVYNMLIPLWMWYVVVRHGYYFLIFHWSASAAYRACVGDVFWGEDMLEPEKRWGLNIALAGAFHIVLVLHLGFGMFEREFVALWWIICSMVAAITGRYLMMDHRGLKRRGGTWIRASLTMCFCGLVLGNGLNEQVPRFAQNKAAVQAATGWPEVTAVIARATRVRLSNLRASKSQMETGRLGRPGPETAVNYICFNHIFLGRVFRRLNRHI